MDPLSDVLSLLKPRSYIAGGFDMGPGVAFLFGPHKGIKCYAVMSGQSWLVVDGVEKPVHLQGGDCFLLVHGRPFKLATDLNMTPMDAMSIVRQPSEQRIRVLNGGGACFMAGAHFLLEGSHAQVLLKMLPPIVHIRKEADREVMRWSMERMRQELLDPQPGSILVAQQMAYTMLVQALRLYVTEAPKGWLFALADKQVSAAMSAMHGNPARRWTLKELAEQAGMSRSVFAQRFKETVGVAAMEYLTRWRMLLAGDRLVNTGDSIAEIALLLGYESESAFSTAFKREMGCPPRQYGRRQNGEIAAGASMNLAHGTLSLAP